MTLALLDYCIDNKEAIGLQMYITSIYIRPFHPLGEDIMNYTSLLYLMPSLVLQKICVGTNYYGKDILRQYPALLHTYYTV